MELAKLDTFGYLTNRLAKDQQTIFGDWLDWQKQDDSAAHSYLEVEPSPRLLDDWKRKNRTETFTRDWLDNKAFNWSEATRP